MKTFLDREDLIFDPPRSGCVLSLTGLPGGDGKIYDRSPYGNIGTITGATWVMLPTGLWCLSFDGTDDYVNCGNHTSLDLVNAVTVEAWYRPGKVANSPRIISKQFNGLATGQCCFQLSASAANARWAIGGVVDVSGCTMSIGTWYHLVGTYDRANGYLYLNGNEIATAAATAAIRTSTQDATIGVGKYNANLSECTLGEIALPRIHNIALTPFEVQRHFNEERHLFGVW